LNKKKIVFLTGTRADFGKLKPLMDKIEKSSFFELYVFVTGMHTLSKYGETYIEVQKRGYKNVFVFMNQTHTTDSDTILANTIMGFSNFVKEIKPDLIVIHGDRIETLAGATVGAFNNILVAHIEGGEISGTVDELIRHAVTKLSHLHFVANEDAKKRLIQMGEDGKNTFVIGSPDIDIMKGDGLPNIKKVKSYYNIPFKNYAILIYHPVTTENLHLNQHVKEVVSAILGSKMNYVVVYPNNDFGSDIILKEYKRFENNKNLKIFPSIKFEYFLQLLKNSDFIIGNSSAGIREAEVFGVPAINIGTRQNNRTNSNNVENVDYDKKKIIQAIKKTKNKKIKPNSLFGDGKSKERFYNILKNKEIWKTSVQKQFKDF